MNNQRKQLLEELVNSSIAKGYCEHCGDPVEDGQYTLCKKHYEIWLETRDYKYLCSIQSSPEFRKLLGIGDIYRNTIKCLKCNDVVTSINGHHFAQCKCQAVATDGGSFYLRRIGHQEDYVDQSISFTHL